MKYGNITGVAKPMPHLVQGTTMIGGRDEEWEFALLDAVYDLGARAFDTANTYAGGNNERAFGKWVRERGVRDEVIVIGKGSHPKGDRHNRVTPEDITSDIHESLERFGFDFIDLYLLHRDDPAVPVGPIVETLNQHQRAGRIGAFGGSNWSVERFAEANAYAHEHGLTPFVASSPNFSLAEQAKPPWEGCLTISGPEHAADRAWYAEHKTPLFTWSSLAGGFFSGRYTRENISSFDDYNSKVVAEAYGIERNFQRLDRASELAKKKGLTLPQIALAYVLSQPLEIYALTAPHSADEYRANAQAAEIKLAPEELAWLDLRAAE